MVHDPVTRLRITHGSGKAIKGMCIYHTYKATTKFGIFRAFEVIWFMKLGEEDLTTGHMLEKNAKRYKKILF